MIKKILVPTDGSDHARKAIEFASDIALKYKAKIYLLHVVTHEPKIPDSITELMGAEHIHESPSYVHLQIVGGKILKLAESEVRTRGVEKVDSVVVEGDPAKNIIDFAREEGVDMIVIGSRGLGGIKDLFLGSVSHKVSHLAHCTCVTIK